MCPARLDRVHTWKFRPVKGGFQTYQVMLTLPWAMITQPVQCKSGLSGLHLHMLNQCMSEGLAACYDKVICSKFVFWATTLWSVIIVVLSFSLPQNPDIVLKSVNASKVLLWKRSIGKLFQQKDCDVLPQVDARIEIWFSNGDSHSHILCQRIGVLRSHPKGLYLNGLSQFFSFLYLI